MTSNRLNTSANLHPDVRHWETSRETEVEPIEAVVESRVAGDEWQRVAVDAAAGIEVAYERIQLRGRRELPTAGVARQDRDSRSAARHQDIHRHAGRQGPQPGTVAARSRDRPRPTASVGGALLGVGPYSRSRSFGSIGPLPKGI